MSATVPLPQPQMPQGIHADTVTIGPTIAPIERIRLFSDRQWEEFVLEWADSLRVTYASVERCGGAGDMGRDVIAFPDMQNLNTWDNFQCKRYDHPLRPTDIWLELGKLVYYTRKGEFAYPRTYTFVAPQGVGTKLGKLLKAPATLRAELVEKWDEYCKNEITTLEKVVLDAELLAYIEGLDFGIFTYIPPLRLIDVHRSTPWHLPRFGGSLPARPEPPAPPAVPLASEANYLQKLYAAYADHLKQDVCDHTALVDNAELTGHFRDSRVEFYSAESLRSLSRDSLPEGTYENLQDEIYDGVRDDIRAQHENGYRRILAVTRTARNLQLTSHPLVPRMRVKDRGGICHQLANDREDVKWVKS